jgi:hypothetical protein
VCFSLLNSTFSDGLRVKWTEPVWLLRTSTSIPIYFDFIWETLVPTEATCSSVKVNRNRWLRNLVATTCSRVKVNRNRWLRNLVPTEATLRLVRVWIGRDVVVFRSSPAMFWPSPWFWPRIYHWYNTEPWVLPSFCEGQNLVTKTSKFWQPFGWLPKFIKVLQLAYQIYAKYFCLSFSDSCQFFYDNL